MSDGDDTASIRRHYEDMEDHDLLVELNMKVHIMCDDVKTNTGNIDKLEAFKNKIIGAVIVIPPLVSILVYLFLK